MPGKYTGGWFMTILLGIAGSWIGGFLISIFGLTSRAADFRGTVVGAILLLEMYGLVSKKR